MKVTFFINYLNHHQLPVADELYRILGDDFRFVATFPRNIAELKGGEDGSTRPYCLLPAERPDDRKLALELVVQSDVCLFGAGNLDWERLRARTDKLSFEISERWFKRGWINLLSPRLWQWWWLYQTRLRNKPFYKLCASAFTASDCRKLLTFRNKCYKWGYFTSIGKFDFEASRDVSKSEIFTPLMWCSRFLILKHPELPVLLADRLKRKGYRMRLDMYGEGAHKARTMALVNELGLEDTVRFFANIPNDDLMRQMRLHSVFLFTSDRNEGWGAVANEALGNGCVLVASEDIGSAPYLVHNGFNGFTFRSPRASSSIKHPDLKALDSLCEKVEWLLDHPQEMETMRRHALLSMQTLWSPQTAARNLLSLINALENGEEPPLSEGPCSIAQ